MHVIFARNVNDAYYQGVNWLLENGELRPSRAGRVLVSPVPVTTVYSHPRERVLFDAKRDANPFFHLMESLWLLAGRNDARWLDQFVGDFSKRFAEEDGTLHGAYGYRWRKHFDVEGGGEQLGRLPDQLTTIVELLKKDPNDRRVVLSMWDPVADLGVNRRDVPCNLCVLPRVRFDKVADAFVLDITVCNRSNDIIWGLWGSNMVQFSILQEYMAARIGVLVGVYTHVSNNFHGYLNTLPERLTPEPSLYEIGGLPDIPLVSDPNAFDADLSVFTNSFDEEFWEDAPYQNEFFWMVAVPMRLAYAQWRAKRYENAVNLIGEIPDCDWKRACRQWFNRRIKKVKNESE